ncbi:MAG: hypothetical protein NVSMB18_29950 [Acetobacteraceae bacterium]
MERAEAFDRYGLPNGEAQAIVIVRPDGYIGWRSESLDVAGCAAFLARCGATRDNVVETEAA